MNVFTKCFTGVFKHDFRTSLYQKVFLLTIILFNLTAQLSFASVEPNLPASSLTPTITGPAAVCVDSWDNVYSTEPGMTDYVWTVSVGGTITSVNGTSSITVTWNSTGAQEVSVIYNTASQPGTLAVDVEPYLTVGISISASANVVCQGTLVTYTATSANGGNSPLYQWNVNGINVGTNSPAFTYAPANGDQVSCQIISSELCTTGSQVTSNIILMVVVPNLPVGVSITASANPICQGVSVTYTATPFNGGSSPQYQWKVNGTAVGSNFPVFSYIPANGDVITCQMISNVTCGSGNPATSNPITMTVSSTVPVSIIITASANPSCLGENVVFTATPFNGGSNPAYQWKVNDINSGPNSAVFSYVPSTGDMITCNLTSNAPCASGNPATSNTVSMIVNPSVPVSVNISASSNPICLGTSVTFTAVPVNGGSNPSYQWMINGFIVGTNNPVYTYAPANGDVVSCQLSSSLPCVSGNPAISDPVIMTVNPSLPVSVFITSSTNPVCQGNSVTLTATPYNGGTNPAYQWKVNGVNAGTSSPTYSYIPLNGDVVSCLMTSNIPCAFGNPVTSNTITLTVSANLPVGVSIVASINPVCQGNPVTFTATSLNGGTSPFYQWKVNGVNAGSNSSAFTYNPVDSDAVSCLMTSSIGCPVGNPAASNVITMDIIASQSMTVGITITASANPSCQGQIINFTATPLNGGTDPTYQWFVNGINVGLNIPTYSYIPTNGDFVKCLLTSSYTCAIGNPATSNQITMTVNPYVNAAVSITASANPSCQGSPVTFTATATNGGTTPAYQWKVNGVNAGTNQSAYTYQPVTGDIISCQMVSNAYCVLNNPVNSNSLTMTVYVSQPVTISISASNNPSCVGSQVTYTATASNAGSSPQFQWKRNGANVGSGGTVYSFIPVSGDQVTCQVNSNATCVIGNRVVLSNQINMIVSSSLEASVSITVSASTFCEGASVTFTATPSNGGTTPVYQWKVNCVNAGSNSPTFTYSPSDGDFVTCTMTSNLSCASPSQVTSNAITMSKNTNTPVSVVISASSNPICLGIPVTFTATPTNGGTAPMYQWRVNGINVGMNNPVFIYTPSNGDIVTCQLSSNAACASGNPALSNPVTMTVSNALPASISISTPTNPFCQGSAVTITAIPVNGGSAPIYQWLKNGTNVGGNSPSYIYYASNGDVVTCQLTSNSTCLSGSNPFTSNTITMVSSTSLPAGVSIASSATTVCQGTPVTVTATPVNGGNNPVYQWTVSGNTTITNQPVYSYIPANGDVVTCQLTSDLTCTSGSPATSNAVTMTVNPIAPVSVNIVASANPVCQGLSVTFTAIPTNGGSAPAYQWKVNCQNAGNNSPTYTYVPENGDVVTCTLTSNVSCSSGNPAISNNINMQVRPILPVSIIISPSVNPFCAGSSVTFTATIVNEGTTPGYQWKVNGVNAGTSPIFTYYPNNGDIVTCQLTSNATCISNNPALSNEVLMISNAGEPVSVSIVASVNPICQGTLVLFTATPVNPGSTPAYQWKVNGVITGFNSPVCQFAPSNNDVVTCRLTSSQSCALNNPAMSNPITMTVYPANPVSIIITASTNPSCEGNSVQFNASITNGGTSPQYQWTVNNGNVGTSIPQYSYIPNNGDVVKCRLFSNVSCPIGNPAYSNPITMTVSPNAPASISITASLNPVCQGANVTFTATPFNGGTAPFYQWKVNGGNVGTNSPVFTYSPANGDAVSCQMISNSICTSILNVTSNTIMMSVSPVQPVSIVIVASVNPTCIGSQVTFFASPSNGGTSPVFQWKVNGIVTGTNNPSFTYTPVNGHVITCVLTSNATCATGNPATSNAITMVVSQSLPAGISITASANPVCQGQPAVFTAAVVNGGTSPSYQWLVNGISVGMNNPVLTYTPSNGDLVKCQMTSSFSCATGSPATSNVIPMTVNPNLPVAVTISSSSNPSCQGTSVTFTATPYNGGSSPSFQWRVNGADVGINSSTYTYTPANENVVTCQLTSNLTCPVGNPVLSNALSMNVLQPLPAGVTIAASANPVCPTIAVTYTATAINGGSAPVYQWKVNGTNAGTNQPFYVYSPADGDIVTCQLTSGSNCVTGNPATSSPITMIVNSSIPASVIIEASSNPACQGQSVTFSATPVNGGNNPIYQWIVNGIIVGTNNPQYSYIPSDGDLVSCHLVSSYPCDPGNSGNSNQILMTVAPEFPVSVSIISSSNPSCIGTTVTFTATHENGGSSPLYQWKVNGGNAGINSPVFTYIPNDGDLVSCHLTSNSGCVTGNPAISNLVSMIVGTSFPVSVSISASANQVCQGTQVTFTASPLNIGASPQYQWKVNGNNAGTNSTIFTYAPENGDVVMCILTSSLVCGTGNPAPSNAITMIVGSSMPPSVSITASPSGSVCEGATVIFNAAAINGGSTPGYQWYHNAVPAGSNQASYACIPVNGDQVYVVMTSSINCNSGNTAISNTLNMVVNPILPASVSVSVNQNNVCQGTSVTFTAAAMNGGSAPGYQWYKNSVPVGTGQPTYSCIPANGDLVYVVLTSGLACVSGNPATSNTISMVVNPTLPVSVSVSVNQNNVCEGTTVTFTAAAMNGGSAPGYQWYKNSLPVGSGQSTYSCIPANGDLVNVVLTSGLTCVSGNPATSNTIAMVVNPMLPVSVSVSVNQNNVCDGTTVTFTAAAINGGSAPVYQWYKNSLPVGSGLSTYSCIPVNGDLVNVVLTSGLTCVSGNPATSNTISMVVNPILPASVSVSVDQNNVCDGTTVTFTAAAINGGSAPVYQWYKNSLPVGSGLSTYSCIPANGDVVYVVMTSGLACVSGNPATSNTISMVVNPTLPVSVSVVVDQNNVCEGTTVTFTATAMNGGTAPGYQWYKNSVPVGTGQPTYSCIPANGDLVYVILTSGLTCVSGNPATSNTISMVVTPLLPVSVLVVVDQNNVCEGTTVTFTATAMNGGSAPFYQWYYNNVPVGSNQPTYTCIPANGDLVYVVMTSGLTCVSGNPATSNTISMVVYLIPATPVVTADGQILECNAPSGNQWYHEGSLIPGATDQTYFATEPGWYWTIVTLNGCSSSESNHVYVSGVGIDEKSAGNKFIAYPVPNDGRFKIYIATTSEEIFRVTVYTSTGSKLYELNEIKVNGRFEQEIDLRPLANGIYSVVFTSVGIKAVSRIVCINKH